MEFCLTEYKKMTSGTSELLPHITTTEEASDQYDCCIGEDLRARSNVPSEFNDLVKNVDNSLIRQRTYFPHVWLNDQNITNGDRPSIVKLVTVPDSITEWSIYGLAQCCTTGFCVSEPVELTVFAPLFVECHLPYSFKRQEQVSVACTAFNYNEHEQPACLRVKDPPENLCTSAGTGKETARVCFKIPGKDSKTILIPLLPLEVGTTKLKVRMETSLGGDEIVKDIRVVPEGVTRDYDYTTELDPKGVNRNVEGGCSLEPPLDARIGKCYKSMSRQGSCIDLIKSDITKKTCCVEYSGSFSVAFSFGDTCELCPSKEEFHKCGEGCTCEGKQQDRMQVNYYYVRVPEDYIEGSEKAWLGVSGKYFSIDEHVDGKVDPIQGIDGLLRRPSGCGEQSMLKFGPNCAVVSFLAATNPGSESPHLPLLRNGYRYQLQYRLENGGFCVWESYGASTWLSSFVLRTMCCARDYIEVDPNVVSGLIDFLGTRQEASGKILEPKQVIHREMVGGVEEGGVSMTAYTVMSYLECCSPEEIPVILTKVCPAVTYMQNELRANRLNRPYAQIIVYLALVKACNYSECLLCKLERVCDDALIQELRRRVLALAIIGDDGSRHWEADASVGKAYWYRYKPAAISVEMTAYALEAFLIVSDCQIAASIAKWLNSARNSRGAFVSTQDTVVALTALSKFAAGCHVSVRHPPELCVKVTSLNDNEYSKNLAVNAKNAALTQRIEVPINDVYKVETCGTGLGQMMVHVEYNIPETGFEQCAFNLTVQAKEVALSSDSENEQAAEISFCARYLGNDCTSMALVEVELPTGYQACDRIEGVDDPLCLKDILNTNSDALELDKYELTDKSVVFYFNKLCSNKNVCLKFKAFRKFEVLHSLPVSIKAYDYYEPSEECTEFYTLGGGSPELSLVCDNSNAGQPTCVCGSGRCPKLEVIHNRLCNACLHHHYVYKVRVKKEDYANGWFKYRVEVLHVLKDGVHNIKNKSKINFWLSSICKTEFQLEVGKDYHVQGLDGLKFVLDHNSQVELWPETTADECGDRVKKECFDKLCKRFKKNKDRKGCERRSKVRCKKQIKKGCSYLEPFEAYVKAISEAAACEKSYICD